MSQAAWNKAFSQGSKALQDRLKKVHAKNPAFQSWFKSSGHGEGQSVKQASKEVKASTRVKSLQAKSLKAYGATKGTKMGDVEGRGETHHDTIAPLTKDQHSKVQAAARAAKPSKPLSRAERMSAIASAVRKAQSKHDVATLDAHDDHDDLRDVHQALHIKKGYNEQVELEEGKMKDIVTDREETARLAAREKDLPFTPDTKKVRRGRGGPMSQAKWLAKQAMLKAMKKEEIESVEEGSDYYSNPRYKAPKSLPLHKNPPKMVTPETAPRRPDGTRNPMFPLPAKKKEVKEEMDLVSEQDDTMEKVEMAQTQLHFICYAAEEILEFVKMGGEVEEWYQNKLSKVHSDMESLHSYIEGEKRRTGMVKEEAEETAEQIEERYMGFKKLKAAIAAKGGARDPGAVAAAIGRKKYGKQRFQAAAAAGKKLGEALDPVGREDKDIDNDGDTDKTDVYLHKKRKAIGAAIKDRLAKKLGAKAGK